MNSTNRKMRNIEQLGNTYISKNLDKWWWPREKLESNWWEALKFFFSHSFMRGRRDELSNEYYHFAVDCLGSCFSVDTGSPDESYERLKEQREHFDKSLILKFKEERGIGRKNSIKDPHFEGEVKSKNPLVCQLVTKSRVKVQWEEKTYEKELYLNNEADVMMVLDVLKFVSHGNRKNIYNYLRGALNTRGVKAVYEELKEIRSVGDKIAACIIRNVGLMNHGVVRGDYEMAFPVDTWVRKVASGLEPDDNATDEAIRSSFIKKCEEEGIDPLKFAAGLWYLGAHSLDVLLKYCLAETDIDVASGC